MWIEITAPPDAQLWPLRWSKRSAICLFGGISVSAVRILSDQSGRKSEGREKNEHGQVVVEHVSRFVHCSWHAYLSMRQAFISEKNNQHTSLLLFYSDNDSGGWKKKKSAIKDVFEFRQREIYIIIEPVPEGIGNQSQAIFHRVLWSEFLREKWITYFVGNCRGVGRSSFTEAFVRPLWLLTWYDKNTIKIQWKIIIIITC